MNEAAVPEEVKKAESGQGGQQPITNYTRVKQKAVEWDKDTSIELILKFIVETDQVSDVLTYNCYATINTLEGPQCHKRPFFPCYDGLPARRET